MDDLFGTSLALINIFLCFFIVFTQFNFLKLKKDSDKSYIWIKKSLFFISIYWGLIYIYVALCNFNIIKPIDPILFGKAIVRPANTLWFGILAVSSWNRLLTRKRNNILKMEKFPRGKEVEKGNHNEAF